MGTEDIVATLMLLTLGAVCVFALRSKSKIEARGADPEAPKSALAADADSHGEPVDVL